MVGGRPVIRLVIICHLLITSDHSWREPWHKFEDWDWFNARNFCRLAVSHEGWNRYQRLPLQRALHGPGQFRVSGGISSLCYHDALWSVYSVLNISDDFNFPDNVSSIYTSGRKCNFLNKGCDASHLQPINVNGWFWADGNKRIPPTNLPSKLTFWSRWAGCGHGSVLGLSSTVACVPESCD